MTYQALKTAVVCLPVVLFGLGGETKAATLFVADNAPGNPIVGKLDASLGSTGFFSVPDSIIGISAGPSGQVFVATETHIYDYTSDGALLRQFRLVGGGGVLGDLAFDGATLFVADNAPGNPIVGKLDASFGSLGFFSVPDSITGITIGPTGQVFVATATHLYDYTSDGDLLRQFRLVGGGGVLGDLTFDAAGGVPISVPEPSTALLLVIGLFAVAAWRRSAPTNARRGSVHGARSFWRGAPS
jgi:hypothetical protein